MTVALSPQSASAGPASTGTGGAVNGHTLTPKCAEQVRRESAVARAKGTTSRTVCTDVVEPPAGPAPAAAVNCSDEEWNFGRLEACVVAWAMIYAIIVPSGQWDGYITYTATTRVTTSATSGEWTMQTDLAATSMWGNMIGTTVYGSGSCTPSCGTQVSFPSQSFATASARASGRATSTTSVTVGSSTTMSHATTMRWYFTNLRWTPQISPPSTAESANVRCDGQYPTVGCVYPVRPVFIISALTNPSFARHVGMAHQYNMPRTLTRMRDEFLATQNGNMACPGILPRPAGFSCDEYPFRSTREGAFTGNAPYGRTFAGCQVTAVPIRQPAETGGYSICMIPEGENLNGGLLLQRFYRENRVLDGERFLVSVASIA
ncbi:NucA/NucB deoxyribonuclease domain-containing protein [Phytohabitans suffuscus]